MATIIKLKRGTTTPTTSDLANGEVGIDTSAKKFYINDSGTIKEIAGSSGDSTSPLAGDVRGYTGDGSTTAFTVTSGADVENVLVFVNGVYQRPTTDYTVSGTTLTFSTAPASSDAVTIKELVEGANALNDTGVVRAYTGDGSTTGYAVTSSKTDVQEFLVFVNGVFQRPTTDYTVSSGTLTFGTAPASSDAITIKELAEGTGSNILTIVDDSSTASTLNAGETLKIAGGSNVTTSISGDTLTISSTASGNLTIADDSSTTTTLDIANDTLKVAGGTGITTSLSGDTLTITGSATQNTFSTINLNDSTNIEADSTSDTLNLDSSGLISITGNASTDTVTVSTVTSATVPFTKADGSSSDIQLQTSGSLADVITNLYIPFTNASGTAVETLVVGSS
jgi:hypothetical protein